MDIFKDTCDHDSVESLELDRFKEKLKEIWMHVLEETYAQYPDIDMDMEHYKEHNALKFADEPEQETEIDNLMAMLDDLMIHPEEEGIKSEGKAPKYGTTNLKTNNETGKKEVTSYEFKHANTKTPSDSRSRNKGGSYVGTPSSSIPKHTDAKIIRSFSPMAESLKEELRTLVERQAIGRRRQLFRL